ncbi:uncharacterized protein LOC114241256 [Bombyx mandarina]|uniref:Uncharacterized protein LOC114241256 n=1 Tax=Bombyx mandarina TaxID=7092 RepID=A0A6J2JHC1_BOMMA|nr:uncharacterized protein LOC114241256 [Bombyx mandarina]
MKNKTIQLIVLFLILITSDLTFGKGNYNKKNLRTHQQNKKHNNTKTKFESERIKRSTNDFGTVQFWTNKEIVRPKYFNSEDSLQNIEDAPIYGKIHNEPPFWAIRGRRDSSSSEIYTEPHSLESDRHDLQQNYDHVTKIGLWNEPDLKHPANFWANRGRRNPLDFDRSFMLEPSWERDLRQENDPFWGNRGKKEEAFWSSKGKTEENPFWANRGRRLDQLEDRANRDSNTDVDPFWGSRGRRKDMEFIKDHKKENLKQSILNAINDVEKDVKTLSRLRRSPGAGLNFWLNRGRDSKLKHLFNRNSNNKAYVSNAGGSTVNTVNPSNAETLSDSRIYADEPHYILLERNSRSSAEDDPFYISRGKKYYLKYNLGRPGRDRRGAIEEIVKSVRNDPYYIARGKKDLTNENSTQRNQYSKIKELVCTAIDMVLKKNNGDVVKRDITDSERDRRTILKKLAAQLQNDPYFASRGKKSSADEGNHLNEFIDSIAEKCS